MSKLGRVFHTDKDTGFTLIEVMIAMAIFAVGFLAMASLQITSTNGATNARLMTEAVAAAERQMEVLMNSTYTGTSVDPALDATSDASNRQSTTGIYNMQWTITDQMDTAGTPLNKKNITLTVTWTSGMFSKSLQFQAVKPMNLFF